MRLVIVCTKKCIGINYGAMQRGCNGEGAKKRSKDGQIREAIAQTVSNGLSEAGDFGIIASKRHRQDRSTCTVACASCL